MGMKTVILDDGWQFGDVAKTIIGSTTDVGENAGAGIIGMGEKALDALMWASTYMAQGQYYSNGGGYSIAAWVGYTRIAQSYHWTADVLVGAAIGTFCTNLVYWAYDGLSDYICSKKEQSLSLMPFYDGRQASLCLSYQF